MIKVKVCGLQRPQDALVAAEAGADFVGLVFVPNRRRRLSQDKAQSIVDRLKERCDRPPRVVGLFADQPMNEVNTIAARCALDMAQLCGAESLEYCGQIVVPVIKVLHVPADPPNQEAVETLPERMKPLIEQGHLVALDRLVEGLQGGTGATFDWKIGAELSSRGFFYILAGGLEPDNVALAVKTARPWGVDVSSGVETKGVKDPVKIRRFVAEAKQAGNDWS